MNNIKSYYKIIEGFADSIFGDAKTKNKMRDLMFINCVNFANQYEEDMNFRREADLTYNLLKNK